MSEAQKITVCTVALPDDVSFCLVFEGELAGVTYGDLCARIQDKYAEVMAEGAFGGGGGLKGEQAEVAFLRNYWNIHIDPSLCLRTICDIDAKPHLPTLGVVMKGHLDGGRNDVRGRRFCGKKARWERGGARAAGESTELTSGSDSDSDCVIITKVEREEPRASVKRRAAPLGAPGAKIVDQISECVGVGGAGEGSGLKKPRPSPTVPPAAVPASMLDVKKEPARIQAHSSDQEMKRTSDEVGWIPERRGGDVLLPPEGAQPLHSQGSKEYSSSGSASERQPVPDPVLDPHRFTFARPEQAFMKAVPNPNRFRFSSALPADPAFIRAQRFEGSKPGFVFKTGKSGLGYYKDVPPATARPEGFVSAQRFEGSKPGLAFKMGAHGLGYYKDVPPAAEGFMPAQRFEGSKPSRFEGFALKDKKQEPASMSFPVGAGGSAVGGASGAQRLHESLAAQKALAAPQGHSAAAQGGAGASAGGGAQPAQPGAVVLRAPDVGQRTIYNMRYFGKLVLRVRRSGGPELSGVLRISEPSFSKLVDAIHHGQLLPVENTYSLLGSINELMRSDNNPWYVRVLLVEMNMDLRWSFAPGVDVVLEANVFMHMNVFNLNSDWDLWNIFEHLEVPWPVIKPPPARVKAPWHKSKIDDGKKSAEGEPHFTSSAPKDPGLNYWFTLPGLLKSVESPGGPELDRHPDGLLVDLFPYQKETVQAMLDREKMPGGLNSLLWEEHKAPLPFFYNRTAGELMAERPVQSTGGFLCEEMGLGKTIEMIALILLNPPEAQQYPRQTLIVVPLSLLEQWRMEFQTRVENGKLQVFVYHCSEGAVINHKAPPEFYAADVVLTTYEQLTREAGSIPKKGKGKRKRAQHSKAVVRNLMNNWWYRVVLDESQRIQNSNAIITDGACMLKRTHSWLMSGTPVGNVVEDLLGQLLFLRVEPWDRISKQQKVVNFWQDQITDRWKACEPEVLDMVHPLLSQILIRHSKTQRARDGSMLVDLPPMHVRTVELDFSDASEEFVYCKMALEAIGEIRALEREGILSQFTMRVISLKDRLLRISSSPANLDLQNVDKEIAQKGQRHREGGPSGEVPIAEKSPAELLRLHPHHDTLKRLVAGERPAKDSDWFQCAICLNTMGSEATMLACAHIYCYACIFGVLKNPVMFDWQAPVSEHQRRGNLQGACPECRAHVRHDEMRHVRLNIDPLAELSGAEVALRRRLQALGEPAPEVLAGLYSESAPGKQEQLYPQALAGETRRVDAHYPLVDGLFLAHYDASAWGHLTVGQMRFGTKVTAAVKILREMLAADPKAKCVVFSGFGRTLQLLDHAMRQTPELAPRLAASEVLITGTTKGAERAGILNSFRQDPQTFVLLLSTKANNAGLTLTEATSLILLDPPAHSAMEAQLINRIHRIGQTKPVNVTRLIIKGTAEERLVAQWVKQGAEDDLAVGCMEDQEGAGGKGKGKEMKEEFMVKLKAVIGAP